MRKDRVRQWSKDFLKLLVLIFALRPFVWFFMGLNRYSRLKIPSTGPLIIAANHNSHLDTVIIFALLPLDTALRTRFVVAGDYFADIPILSWVLFDLFEMIPIWRTKGATQPNSTPDIETQLQLMVDALHKGATLVLFPEGSRGVPEQRVALKGGIARIASRCQNVPIFPIYLRGLGKALPRNELIFIPLIPQVAAGELILTDHKSTHQIMKELSDSFLLLEGKISTKDWLPI